ncbi:MAG: type II secretion system protein, partial [Candidatus Zixiibacteriota bacterium]
MVSLPHRIRSSSSGFSLVELAIVIVVIGIMAAVVMQSMTAQLSDARRIKTEREMEMLARAIVGDPSATSSKGRRDFGYVGDIGAFPPNLQALYQNPGGYGTWKGPYIDFGFTQDSTGFKLDEWGTAYGYAGVTLTSTGSGSTITKKFADASSDYLVNTLTGTVKDKDGNSPGAVYADSIDIEITFPDGAGGLTGKTTSPDSAGAFSVDSLPVGIHQTLVIYEPNQDTLLRFVTVLPRHKGTETFVLPLSFGTGGSSGVTFEEFTEAKRANNGTDITVSTPAGTSQGDLLIAAVVTDGNTSGTLAPPGGEGWTEIDIGQQSGAVTLGVWWKLADASESPSHQFTWSGGGQESYAWIMRFTGHDPTSPINASATNGGSSGSPTCPSVTTTVANTMIVRIGGFDDDDINVDNTGLSG